MPRHTFDVDRHATLTPNGDLLFPAYQDPATALHRLPLHLPHIAFNRTPKLGIYYIYSFRTKSSPRPPIPPLPGPNPNPLCSTIRRLTTRTINANIGKMFTPHQSEVCI